MQSHFHSPVKQPDNTFYWLLALQPLFATALAMLLVAGDASRGAYVVTSFAVLFLMIATAVADQRRLEAVGYDTADCATFWITLLPPVYVWKRANVAGQNQWGATLFIALLVAIRIASSP